MRKLFLFFLALALLHTANCQTQFGAKAGINVATTRDIFEYPRNRVGWYAGGNVKFLLSKRFFLQPEALYSSKGNKIDQFNNAGSTYRFNYIDVPIIIGFKIDTKTSLIFGPEFGYLISARYYLVGATIFNVYDNYPSKYDASVDVGASYNILKNIGVEVRYSYGFKTIYYVDDAGIRYSDHNGGHRVFQLGITYSLNKYNTH